jgi:hypothetical protein
MKLITTLLLLSQSALANMVENVSVLETESTATGVVVKLHAPVSGRGSYFFVHINKGDPTGFEKLAKLLQKIQSGPQIKMDLDIISFSLSPSGALYPSESVKFSLSSSDQAKQRAAILNQKARLPAGK